MKRLRRYARKGLVLYLSLALLIIGGLPDNVMAALIPTNVSVSAEGGATIDRAADTQTIQRVLESKIVVQRLTDMGLSVEEVQTSMAKLTPEDLHQIATNLDGVQAGGDAGVVIFILVVIVLILLIVFLAQRV